MNILMPQLGETVTEGRILAWYKSVGDAIEPGDTLFDVETEKVSMEVPAISRGTLSEIRVAVGEVAPVGAVVATVTDDAAGTAPVAVPPVARQDPPARSAQIATSAPSIVAAVSRSAPPMTPFAEVQGLSRNFGPARIDNGALTTPYARRLASQLGVPLSEVRGSGPEGRISGRDVATHDRVSSGDAVQRQYLAGAYTVKSVGGMRAAIARRLVESTQTIPQFHLTIDIDGAALARRREALNASCAETQEELERVSLNDLLIEAWAAALKNVPAANAVWAGGRILEFQHVNLGVAVALEEGLVTPVLRDVDTKSVREVAREVRELIRRARARKLKQEELRGGVSTISNLGMYGVREFAGIINPPQSTLLAVGTSQRRPIEGSDGGVRFEPRMTVTVVCDHRIIDGALGARLLAEFRKFVEA